MNTTENTVKLVARLPASLHRKLQEQAQEHRRSLNSEMIEVLSAGLSAKQTLSEAEQKIAESERRVDDHARRLEELLRVQNERIERLAGQYRTIEAWRVAERKNWALGDLFDEAPQQEVNKEEPE